MTEVRQAANVVELIEWFSRHGQPATLAEIADALGWPRSSTFNLLGTLADRGYLYEPRTRGGYYPSSRWASIAHALSMSEPLGAGIENEVANLQAATGETVAVAAPAGTSALYLHVLESNSAIRYSTEPGRKVPIHSTSSGRALLSQYSPSERSSLYRKIDFVFYGPATPMDATAVEGRLAEEAERGFHMSNEEYSPDLLGIAVPIRIGDRRLALTIGGPRIRCLPKIDEFVPLLVTAGLACQQMTDGGTTR